MVAFNEHASVWEMKLTHEDINNIKNNLDAPWAAAAGPLAIAIQLVVKSAAGLISIVDAVGGNYGVNITGIIGTQLICVTPLQFSPFGILRSFADQLRHATGLPEGVVGAGIGAGIALLAVGPAGVVIGGLVGFLDIRWNEPPRTPGAVSCDRDAVGPWEKFLLVTTVPEPNHFAVSSWQGFFSAQQGGGADVWANRREIGPWEKFTLIRNPNGTVSFRTDSGHFLTAGLGGGPLPDGVCNWNRNQIGEWEQFWMEHQADGTFALKTLQHNKYVSVQP